MMRMVLLASYFLVALAVAEATPQVFGDGEIRIKGQFVHEFEAANAPITQSQFVFDKNSGSYFTVWETITPTQVVKVTPVTQSQFGHNVNFRDPSFFAAQTVAPFQAAPAPPFTQPQDDSNIHDYDYNFRDLEGLFGESPPGIIEQDDSNIDYYDYDYDYSESEPGIIVLKTKQKDHPHPVQADKSCASDCLCTKQGGFCIPAHQNCTDSDSVPGEPGGYCKAKPSSKSCKCCRKPTVYKQDIENTVVYFLRNITVYNITTGLKKPQRIVRTLNRDVQKDLSNIIETFAKHLPLKPSFVRFLNCLSGRLPTSHESIRGTDLTDIYKGCENSTQQLPKVGDWVGCRNLEGYKWPNWQSFRSYPCGVWTTFHTITVNLTYEIPQQDGTIILQTLHNMVKHFPWCRDCKRHFLGMYKTLDKGADKMHTSKQDVMWLWKGHNRVTARTATNFTGPYAKLYDDQCSAIGLNLRYKSFSDCKALCQQEPNCTAINYSHHYDFCQLRACGYPVPPPNSPSWLKMQGYAIAAGKGTDQGRSQWQFPGENQCPGCQSSESQEYPCKYPQFHQWDGCFNHDEVYQHLRTWYSTFY